MPLVPGARLGPYEVLSSLGAGGMGEVYRARDTRLAREVAIKVLPLHLSSDTDRKARFEREARAISSLSHPHICMLYDVGHQDGADFLVMELLEGKTLDQEIDFRPVPNPRLLDLAIQVVDGLEAAHSKGIVHRDLKPTNIFITKQGQAKILDFGLAQQPLRAKDATPDFAASTAQSEFLTRSGTIVGTLEYMSPEQARGEKLDARSDLFSFGAVLYAMATGRPPFSGNTIALVFDAILHAQPPSPARLNPDCLPGLESILQKALEKNRDFRYQSSTELRTDLKRLARMSDHSETEPARERIKGRGPTRKEFLYWAGVVVTALVLITLGFNLRAVRRAFTPGKIPMSLAVLPLQNLSGEPGQDYFADGMTEEVIAALGRIGALRVISRTSVMPYKNTRKSLPEIARKLDVDAIVQGSVTQARDRVRITAQLIRASDEKQLWGESYERDLKDVLSLQDEVATTIAREIDVSITADEAERLGRSRPVNPEAHDAYLQGRFHLRKRERAQITQAIAYFNRALDADPAYAPAHAGLADAYRMEGTLFVAPRDIVPKARQEAKKALELDDSLAEAHVTLARIHLFYEWDWAQAEQEFQRALRLNPSGADTHAGYALFLALRGNEDQSIAQFNIARQLDPLSLPVAVNSTFPHLVQRDTEKATQQLRSTLALDPTFSLAHSWMGYCLEQENRFAEAIDEYQKARKFDDAPLILGWMGHAYAASGQKAAAEALLRQLDGERQRYVCPTNQALIYVALKDRENAIASLQRAYDERSECLQLLKFDSRLDPLRRDPRFQDLSRRIGILP